MSPSTALTAVGLVLLALLAAVVVAALVALRLAATPDLPVEALLARWAGPPSRFVALDGMRVHLRDEGPRDDPAPLVLLHGTGASLHTWQGWVERLAGHRRLIRLDRPGFGLTGPSPSGDYAMAAYADVLRRLLDQLEIPCAVVVGNSSGGRMAWAFALAHPERVAALVLLAPGGYPRTTPLPLGLRIARSRLFGPLLERVLPRAQVRKGLEASYGDPGRVTEEQVARSYELTLRAGNRRALGETVRQAEARDLSGEIRGVRAPTLLLWGDRDTVVPAEPDAARFARDIAGSRLVMVPGVGHLAQEEAPAETAAITDRWLHEAGLGCSSPTGTFTPSTRPPSVTPGAG